MASAVYHHSRILFVAFFVTLSQFLLGAVHAQEATPLPAYVVKQFGKPPAVPKGPLSEAMKFAVKVAFVDSMTQGNWSRDQTAALAEIQASKDPRLAWFISDLLRFATGARLDSELAGAASELLGKDLQRQNSWGVVTDHLIAWDIPEPPGYLEVKRVIFTSILPKWDKIFVEGTIDWRHEVTNATDAKWLKDSDIVFGVAVNGEYRAYPRRIMEVREMVNDTLGGRDLGIPYCTLCGAAQAYFTDRLPAGVERPILRTSGLLIRSNKVMYDLTTFSVFDTFLGHAVTGPLAEKKIKLKQASVVTTDWGTWKKAHPETTVLKERYALGRDPDFRNGRDSNGPIFPIGNVDPRLPVHEDIIGILTASGKPIAFQRSKAFLALKAGKKIGFENVSLELDAGGIKVVDADGSDLGSHQAFWFAWSQFHPETELWDG